MSINNFAATTSLFELAEIEKVRLLAFYHFKISNQAEFSIKDVDGWFQTLSLGKPNSTRLKTNLLKSPNFVRGVASGKFRLHAREIAKLEIKFPEIGSNEEVISHGSVLPESLYLVGKSNIESLAKQINASYENNIYDGCAVLMRRLIEVLLILSYEHLGIENLIRQDGNYMMLEKIVNDAKSNSTLKLSRSRSCLDTFRTLGNFSAHKIYYTCKPEYIEQVIPDFRVTVEELLFKAGLKT